MCSSDLKVNIGSQEATKITSDPNFGGYLDLNTGGDLHLNGDLNVEGTLRAGDIVSQTSVSAGLGVQAGPLGFVSVMGGLSIGVPVALPGIINCIGIINADVMMTSPIAQFGLMDAVLMTDNINTMLHNVHFHIGFKGPTGPPIPKMV